MTYDVVEYKLDGNLAVNKNNLDSPIFSPMLYPSNKQPVLWLPQCSAHWERKMMCQAKWKNSDPANIFLTILKICHVMLKFIFYTISF